MLSIYKEYSTHLEEIFAHSFDYIYLHDKAGNLIDVNDVVIENLGYSKEEILNMNVIDLLVEDAILEVSEELNRMIETGIVNEPKIYKVQTKKGNIVYVEANTIPLRKNGKIYAILGIGHDVTKYKRLEQDLRTSEENYRNIIENTTDVIIVTRFDGKHIYISPQYSQLLGYSEEEADRIMFELIHPDDRERIIDFYRKSIEEKQTIISELEQRWKHKDGHYIWVATTSKNYYNKEGEVIGWITSIREITESKKAEEKLKESEEKFRNIAEQVLMGIVIIQEGKFKYMNNAMAKISGYPVSELMNWSEKEMLKMIYPEDVKEIIDRLQSNIAGKMGSFSNNFFRIIDRNGEIRWLQDNTTKILYEGKVANLVSIVDITEKKLAEELIIEENKRLLELHELRKDLITRVSHELKTPMSSIYGASQILIQLYLDDINKEARKYIEIGHRGCLRLKQLIENLLDVSRLDAKKLDLNIQNENIVELIIDCVKDMNYLISNRLLKLKLELPNEVYIDIDRLRFRQVLTNIISNAIKNTPKEGEILIKLVELADLIDIIIKDTGVGLTESEKGKLFEKFGKIERYGMDLGVDIEGSGIGLYISKELVELHGGIILVESEGRNKGSTFTLRLFK